MTKVSLCVVGWHLKPALLTEISKLYNVTDFYIAAHKTIDSHYSEMLVKQQYKIHYFENKGYDWGAYQQWLNLNLWQNYDYCFFIHDDVIVKNKNLITMSIEQIKNDNLCLLGNGPNAKKHQEWPKTHKKYYEHSNWKPEPDYKHLTVRGSYFGIAKESLEKINGEFEVYWDAPSLKSANMSLVATCGKITKLTNKNIGYLSNTYMNSVYLTEIYRGVKYEPFTITKPKKLVKETIKKIFANRKNRL